MEQKCKIIYLKKKEMLEKLDIKVFLRSMSSRRRSYLIVEQHEEVRSNLHIGHKPIY